MILVLTHLIALVVGVISGMGVAFAVNSHLRVRRKLKEAQAALEARETAPQPRIKEVQARVDGIEGELRKIVEPLFRDPSGSAKPVPDFTGGIGPTAIRNREAFEAQRDADKKEPRFASRETLNPDLADIQAAAREATNGGKPN